MKIENGPVSFSIVCPDTLYSYGQFGMNWVPAAIGPSSHGSHVLAGIQ